MKKLTSIAEHSDWLDKSPYMNNRKWELHRQRVDFGKQPLALWMFVPCELVDGVWVVLKEPNTENEKYRMIVGEEKENILDLHSFDCDVEEYQQAKERCLFEGFEMDNSFVTHKSHNSFFYPISCLHEQTIEDLVKYNLELTKTAQL